MNWFWIALIGPFLWSVSNHIDKYLLSKYFKDLGIGALIIFSSLVGLIVLPIVLLIEPHVFNVSLFQAVMIMAAGVLVTFGWLAYLYALEIDEASLVSSLFQTIPIFLYILAYIFLRETMTLTQIMASLLIISGGLAITWDFDRKKFKAKVFWLMLIASACIAGEGIIFKIFALETDFWTTSFWEYVGSLILGAVFLGFFSSYRRNFITLWKNSRTALIGINLFNEIITVVGILTFRYAMLLAPLALVQSVNGFQTLIGVLIAIFLTVFFPKISQEKIGWKNLAQKAVAVIIMLVGAYLIERGS